jgi:hypothetical protein
MLREHPDENKKVKGIGFFILNLRQITRMVMLGAGAEELLAYLVLSRGTGRSQTVSTHGANSISVRTGLSRHGAVNALNWLEENSIIKRAEETDEKVKKRKARWHLVETREVEELALSNSLLDGIGRGENNPPMARLYEEAKLGSHCVVADARLDALLVLLCLYRHHHIADCGGVNPRSGIYRYWHAAEDRYGNKVQDIKGTGAALFEIGGGNVSAFSRFSKEALFNVEDDKERTERFWHAFHSLCKLGFVYEVIQIWNEDPVKDERAGPLYTLYVRDRHARQSDPYLSRQIHEVGLRCGALDSYVEFSADVPFDSGRFRYIASKSEGGYPIGHRQGPCGGTAAS